MSADLINAPDIASALRDLARAQHRLADLLEVYFEAVPLSTHAKILGVSSKRIQRARRKAQGERLLRY
jgi:hypothetical protein